MTDEQHDTGLPWQMPEEPRSHSGSDSAGRGTFDRSWFARPIPDLARALLGCRLRSTVDGEPVEGLIVETEAYLGPEDPASHAATRTGITDRNRPMFGPAGFAYVYRIYGMHWCLNVVGGREGEVGAVLIRGAEPILGRETVTRRRDRRSDPANGPGRLARAFGVDGSLTGHDLTAPPLQVLPGWDVPDRRVAQTGRVGVRAGRDWPLRYIVAGSSGVSPARPHPGDPASLPPDLTSDPR